jgi:hypothetical protein
LTKQLLSTQGYYAKIYIQRQFLDNKKGIQKMHIHNNLDGKYFV